jgi:hypothetical protein
MVLFDCGYEILVYEIKKPLPKIPWERFSEEA